MKRHSAALFGAAIISTTLGASVALSQQSETPPAKEEEEKVCLQANRMMNYDIIDPVMYVKPWNLERPLTPLKAVHGMGELIEYSCNENNKDLQHLVSTKPAADK